MKKLLTLTILSFTYFVTFSQALTGPLVKGKAPSFVAESTMGRINFPEDYFGKWKIVFSHPADFTPVCTSEILALASIQDDFKKLNTALLVLSTDGLNSHLEWVRSMESIDYNGNGKLKIKFPIISDDNYVVSRKYGILQPDTIIKKDIRAVFFIDMDDQIQAMFYYPLSVGRNIDEIKRTLIALQTEEKYQVYTPANWKPGDEVLIPSPGTIAEAEKLKEKNPKGLRFVTWYMWFKTI